MVCQVDGIVTGDNLGVVVWCYSCFSATALAQGEGSCNAIYPIRSCLMKLSAVFEIACHAGIHSGLAGSHTKMCDPGEPPDHKTLRYGSSLSHWPLPEVQQHSERHKAQRHALTSALAADYYSFSLLSLCASMFFDLPGKDSSSRWASLAVAVAPARRQYRGAGFYNCVNCRLKACCDFVCPDLVQRRTGFVWGTSRHQAKLDLLLLFKVLAL
jgi:hypothetical protein